MKKTEWYPISINPKRKGLYECKCCGDLFFWSGKKWFWEDEKTPTTFPKMGSWRGIAK